MKGLVAGEVNDGAERSSQFIQYTGCLLDRRVGHDHQELLTAVASNDVGTAQPLSEDTRKASNNAIADRVAMLHGGKIRWSGPVGEMDQSGDPYVAQFISGSAEGPIETVR